MAPEARNMFGGPGSKCAVMKKVPSRLLGLFGATQLFGARGIVLPLTPLATPLVVTECVADSAVKKLNTNLLQSWQCSQGNDISLK